MRASRASLIVAGIALGIAVAWTGLATKPSVEAAATALATEHYDAAEAILRTYTTPAKGGVIHLSCNEKPLPPAFLRRFADQPAVVRGATGRARVTDKSPRPDRQTQREAVRVDISDLRGAGARVELRVRHSDASTSISTWYTLIRERGRWRVWEEKTEWIACGRGR